MTRSKPLIDKYRGAASQIYFPYPEPLSGTSEKDGSALLVIVFDRTQYCRERPLKLKRPHRGHGTRREHSFQGLPSDSRRMARDSRSCS